MLSLSRLFLFSLLLNFSSAFAGDKVIYEVLPLDMTAREEVSLQVGRLTINETSTSKKQLRVRMALPQLSDLKVVYLEGTTPTGHGAEKLTWKREIPWSKKSGVAMVGCQGNVQWVKNEMVKGESVGIFDFCFEVNGQNSHLNSEMINEHTQFQVNVLYYGSSNEAPTNETKVGEETVTHKATSGLWQAWLN